MLSCLSPSSPLDRLTRSCSRSKVLILLRLLWIDLMALFEKGLWEEFQGSLCCIAVVFIYSCIVLLVHGGWLTCCDGELGGRFSHLAHLERGHEMRHALYTSGP